MRTAVKPRHAFVAALLVALEAPILGALVFGWLVAGSAYLLVSLVRALVQTLLDPFSVLWARLGYRRRWLQFIPPLVLFPLAFGVAFHFGEAETQKESFLQDYASFFQTAAQVIAALLVALAVEARAPRSLEDRIALRPAIMLTVVLLGVAELASLSALSPSLPAAVYRPVFALTVGAGIAALLAVALVSLRILQE